jgi:Iap family predicted aminopeptidase
MNKHPGFKLALLAAALLALPVAHAATMSKVDYASGKTRINADAKADKAACDAQSGNAKDICVEQAKAKEKVALAELHYSYTGKPADHNKVLVAQAESSYAVAKERCDDLAGNPKDVCVKEAKAVEVKALADAKMGQEIGAAHHDAMSDKRDADYNVAVEKCGALAGDAKSSCLATAKTSYGKN